MLLSFQVLDPNSIESISFLKDAAFAILRSCSLWCCIGKIKGGKEGDLKISYDGSVAVKMATYTPDVLGSEWYARLSNEAALNEKRIPVRFLIQIKKYKCSAMALIRICIQIQIGMI